MSCHEVSLGVSHAFLLLIHISGVVSKENAIVPCDEWQWMDDGHGTGTNDWWLESQGKK